MIQMPMFGRIRTAMVILLCAAFFLLAMGLTLLGSNAYRSTASDADQNDSTRTALSYLVNRVRQSDTEGGISVTTFGGTDALQLTQTISNERYVTLLYCYDNHLRELFTAEGTTLTPADGIEILSLSSLHLQQSGKVLSISVTTPGGYVAQVSVAPRCQLGVTS